MSQLTPHPEAANTSADLAPIKTIADYSSGPIRTLAPAFRELSFVRDRGILFEDQRIPWSVAVHEVAVRISLLHELLATRRGPAHIGVLLPNVPEYIHLLGAAACSEFVIVGLNSTRRGEALARDIALADCAVVITDTENAGLLEGVDIGSTQVVRIDSAGWHELLGRHSGAVLDLDSLDRVNPDDLVGLIFTSGTSGDPKAVRVTQAKIAIPATMLTERFGIGADDCIYNAMPLFHSNAVLVAWPMALMGGCSLALRRKFSASKWLSDVRRYRATFANYVGAPLSYILATKARPDDADNPMRIVYGNEAPPAVRRAFTERFGVRVVDGFGSSEGGLSVSRTPDTPESALGPLRTGMRVVNTDTDAPCPAARFDPQGKLLNGDEAIGELVAEGRGLFAGYYNDPAAEAERLRGGLFRSGDLAYCDESGYVYFAGRASGWMRVDGENLAASPIEKILQRHPDIAEVSVFALPAQGPFASASEGSDRVAVAIGDRVVAAIVTRTGVTPDSIACGMREFLAAQGDLGPKQWPSLLRVCKELPRTASFKVRARELAERGTAPGASQDRIYLRSGPAPGSFDPL